MIWFIIGIVIALALVLYSLVGNEGRVAALVLAVVAVLAGVGVGSVYAQDPGEAKAIRSISGELVRVDTEEGFGTTAPWNKVIDFDLKNQQIQYSDQIPESDGPDITTTDKDGVAADYDVVVTYSINNDPDSISDIYRSYQTQEALEDRLIKNEVRSTVRQIPNTYSTLEVLSKRGEIETDIQAALQESFADDGITVDAVALQDIIYPDDVKGRLAEAQNAKTDLETARTNAEKRKVEANAEAEANRTITESLSEEILTLRKIEAYKEGTVFVVPEGSDNLVQVNK